MPALFAYLFSLIIFVGGGYAGLVWLTEPPAAVPTVMATAKAHPHPHRRPQPDLSPEASGSDASDTEQPPSAKQAGAAQPDTERPNAAKEVEASQPPGKVGDKTGAVADEAIADKKPDQRTALVDSSTPTQRAGPTGSTTSQIDHADNQPSERAKPGGDTQPKAVLSQEPTSTQATQTQTTVAHASVRPPSHPRKMASIRSDAEKNRERHSAPRTSQSHLVMMTLQTLEFADGHREQRLMPLRRSGPEEDD